MPDIFHDFPIEASASRVFAAVSSPAGLDRWWTKTCSAEERLGGTYNLGFGPDYNWHGTVTKWKPSEAFELTIAKSHKDWDGSRVGFRLEEGNGTTTVHFYHVGWPENNDHYRISCYCWAMYLRLLKRSIEFNETVDYEKRLDV